MPARRPTRARSRPTRPARDSLNRLDVNRLWKVFEDEAWSEGLYERARDGYLQQFGKPTMNVAALVKEMDDCLLELAIRRAGFLVGFEACRQLLLGELDLAALQAKTGGAR